MTDEQARDLETRMGEAIAAEDYERAATLRDQLAVLRPDAPPRLRRGSPGAMGLGTDTARHRPPEGWTPPPRPDLGVANVKRGGRRKS